jgi:hypothetical protein
MEAAIRVVALILWPLQLVRGHNMQRHFERAGELAGLLEITPRKAGRIRQHRQHASTEHAMRSGGQESRIHAS